jgi:hypothetical protein
MRRTHLGTALVVLLLVLAGCSGAGGGGGSVDMAASGGGDGGSAEATGAPQATATAAESRASSGSDGTAAAQADRAIIRTGRIALTVDSYGDARDRVARLARERGGYVATSSRETRGEGNDTWTTGRVVVRVPSESFTDSFATIETYGEVRESAADTQDVTDRLVDIEARLETLRAERDRLRELYREANETEDVLDISEQLSDVQTEIERLTAQRRALEDRVAYSTITVELREEPPERPTPTPRPGYADTALGTAFLASVDGVVTAVRALAVTVAYALPYLFAFGLPLAGMTVAVVRWRR